ncbi:MAG TPA: CoA-binding protein [Dehalococcoidia bacterium]|nr:CoA-binding protein [Dehalococcoidia bacterium]
MPEGSFASLDFMFHPRSVAVVGASTQEGPGSFVSAIQEIGFRGDLYPVNPKAQEIAGLRCYPRLTEIPGDVDHVISSVPLRFVEQLVEECVAKRVKVLHFFTAGFSETGDAEAAELERRVLARATAAGIRVIGPNCMGLYVPAAGLSFMPFLPLEPGPIALLSQSGANAGEFCRTGGVRGLRYSKVVSYGNGSDVRESELLEYAAEDPDSTVIACYIEGIRDGAHFMRALRRAAAVKPVVILKGGRTDAGSRAATSHTGSLAGSLQIFDAAARQAGAVRVERMDELVDMSVAFRFLSGLRGPRAGIVGGGGGYSVLASDEVGAAGLEMPMLPVEIQQKLHDFTPTAGTSVRNPVDTSVGWGPDGLKPMLDTIRIVAEATNVDYILYHTSWGWGPRSGPDIVEHARLQGEKLGELRGEIGKPIVCVARTPTTAQGMEATLEFQEVCARSGLATFPSVQAAALSLRRLLDWQAGREPASAK